MNLQTTDVGRTATFQQLYTLVAVFHSTFTLTDDERSELFGRHMADVQPVRPATAVPATIAEPAKVRTVKAPKVATVKAKPVKALKVPVSVAAVDPQVTDSGKPNQRETPTSETPEKEMRAYYTRTAPYFDLQFTLTYGTMSDGLRADALRLAETVDADGKFKKGTTRAIFYRQLVALKNRKMHESERSDWTTGSHSTWNLEAHTSTLKAQAWKTARKAWALICRASAWKIARSSDASRLPIVSHVDDRSPVERAIACEVSAVEGRRSPSNVLTTIATLRGHTEQARYYAHRMHVDAAGDWTCVGWTRLDNGAILPVFLLLNGLRVVIVDTRRVINTKLVCGLDNAHIKATEAECYPAAA